VCRRQPVEIHDVRDFGVEAYRQGDQFRGDFRAVVGVSIQRRRRR